MFVWRSCWTKQSICNLRRHEAHVATLMMDFLVFFKTVLMRAKTWEIRFNRRYFRAFVKYLPTRDDTTFQKLISSPVAKLKYCYVMLSDKVGCHPDAFHSNQWRQVILLRTHHDDVIKWRHFPRNWPFVRGIHRSRWIPHTKASDAELWCFVWSASE